MRQREELTRFRKASRARINPADVGLPPRDRRRDKGLSRDEVAMLAPMDAETVAILARIAAEEGGSVRSTLS